MKLCPFCAEEIQDAAVVCKHCGRDLNAEAPPPPNPAPKKPSPYEFSLRPTEKVGRLKGGCAVLSGLFVLAALAIAVFDPPKPAPAPRDAPAAPAAPVASTPQLELLSWNWNQGYGYATVEGQVKNISGAAIQNAQAVATFHTAEGTFISSADGLLDFNPILPGQTSPFKVMATWNPAMREARMGFKTLFGGAIPWKQAPPPPPRSKRK